MEESPDQVYAANRGLIRSLINSIVVNNRSVVSVEDLQQAGALALIVALRTYDPSVGSFQSYIRCCIRNALLEEANSFNSIFTVDEKLRRQTNAILKMREQGLSDDTIMTRLGIKTRATFLSLLQLGNYAIELHKVDIEDNFSPDKDDILRLLNEIGLNDVELEFVNFIINNHSMDDIAIKMNLSRSYLFTVKATIRDKILEWGRNE